MQSEGRFGTRPGAQRLSTGKGVLQESLLVKQGPSLLLDGGDALLDDGAQVLGRRVGQVAAHLVQRAASGFQRRNQQKVAQLQRRVQRVAVLAHGHRLQKPYGAVVAQGLLGGLAQFGELPAADERGGGGVIQE